MKEIKNLPGYFATKDGRIYSMKTDKYLAQFTTRGYKQINVYHNGGHQVYYVHKLVAETFIENLENKTHVLHLNGDKTDNRVENLVWASHEESMNKARSLTTYKTGRYNKMVLQFDLDGNFIKAYDTITQASKATGVNDTCISDCTRGTQKTAGGFVWYRKPLEELLED